MIVTDTIVESAYTRLMQALRALRDGERAEWEKRYQKSRWEHWGISLPNMDVAIREARSAILSRMRRTPSACACGANRCGTSRSSQGGSWRESRWQPATVASRCLIEDPSRLDVVEAWIENPHVWTRRAALVFTLPWTEEKRDPERMLGWAARLGEDPEWFIQKAIGWQLRELSKRDPERVRRFLSDQGGKLTAADKADLLRIKQDALKKPGG